MKEVFQLDFYGEELSEEQIKVAQELIPDDYSTSYESCLEAGELILKNFEGITSFTIVKEYWRDNE